MENQQRQFTDKELEVIHLLLEGKSTQEIALRLAVSTRAIEHHLTRIYEKLGVGSRTEAVVKLIHLFKK
ncbi:MAG: helix-turn-helix transcriptional regulator [Anaerolineales bacterium]|nr:helix-turn-helix transcriptional regulator [Anaerolineales bacterium]MCL4261042.1 helix-turn-helix transcriptional regulator [Anaerolineales bacterium]